MVTQNKLRTCGGKQVFFEEKEKFIIMTTLDPNIPQTDQITDLHTCAPISELPSKLSTMNSCGFASACVQLT